MESECERAGERVSKGVRARALTLAHSSKQARSRKPKERNTKWDSLHTCDRAEKPNSNQRGKSIPILAHMTSCFVFRCSPVFCSCRPLLLLLLSENVILLFVTRYSYALCAVCCAALGCTLYIYPYVQHTNILYAHTHSHTHPHCTYISTLRHI